MKSKKISKDTWKNKSLKKMLIKKIKSLFKYKLQINNSSQISRNTHSNYQNLKFHPSSPLQTFQLSLPFLIGNPSPY